MHILAYAAAQVATRDIAVCVMISFRYWLKVHVIKKKRADYGINVMTFGVTGKVTN